MSNISSTSLTDSVKRELNQSWELLGSLLYFGGKYLGVI